MSDPLAHDYSTGPVLSEAQRHRALLTLVQQVGNAPDVLDLIDAFGLTDVADARRAEIRRNRGRVSSPQPAPESVPKAIPAPEETRMCHKQLHLMATHGRQRSDGRWWCTACQSDARKAKIHPADPRLGPGEKWCGCEGERHILTPVTSETTYVRPCGKRQCRKARKASQTKQDAARRGRAA